MAAPDALQQVVETDPFEGPFDLLLTLVLREEVDLLELPLVEVVAAALGEGVPERWDAATAGELVVLLSAVAEIKARMLLGEEVDEEPDPDAVEARERLAARLIEHAPFARAAEWLAERARREEGPRYRRVPPPEAAPPAPPREDPARLAAAMAPLLVAPPAPALEHLTNRVSLPEALTRLRDSLGRARAALSFEALTRGTSAVEEAVTLMAALELARRGEVALAQPEPFGDITIHGRHG